MSATEMIGNIRTLLKEKSNYGNGIFREYQIRFHPTNYYRIQSSLIQGEKDGIF